MPDSPTRRFPLSHLALLSTAVMLTVSLETLPAGLLPAMATEFARPTSAIGTLVSVWGFSVIITSIPLVRLVAAWDRRTTTALCLAITGALGLATAFAPTYGIAVVTRVLGGASHGVFWALVVVYAASLAPARYLAAGIALVTGGSQLAAAVVIPATAALVEYVDWRWIYGGLSILAILIAAAVLTLPRDIPSPPGSHPEASGATWRDPRLHAPFALAVVALFFVFAHFAVYTYMAVLFTAPDGSASPSLSTYLAIIGVASILGLALSGPLANRWPRYGVGVYLLVFALGLVLILPATPAIRVGGLALWGLMFGVIGPASQALALRFAPAQKRALISAAMVVTFNLGISLGSFTGGVVIDRASPTLNPMIAAGVLVAASALAFWAGTRAQEEPRQIPASS